MRLQAAIMLFLLCGKVSTYAQKYDYRWMTGYDSYAIHDTNTSHTFGISRFDFNQPAVVITLDSLGISFNRCISVISDSLGNVLFYTNGVTLHNFLDELVENGDSLGWGPLYTFVAPGDYQIGNAIPDILISLPNPRLQNVFDLFYGYIDTLYGGINIANTKLLKARVDMDANHGRGAMVEKDQVVYDQQKTDMSVTAVKHANGSDWWICTGIVGSNCYNVMLFDGTDNIRQSIQCGGANLSSDDLNGARFSPDGSIYMLVNSHGAGSIFNFDRCSGTLSLKEQFNANTIGDSIHNSPWGLSFHRIAVLYMFFAGKELFSWICRQVLLVAA